MDRKNRHDYNTLTPYLRGEDSQINFQNQPNHYTVHRYTCYSCLYDFNDFTNQGYLCIFAYYMKSNHYGDFKTILVIYLNEAW